MAIKLPSIPEPGDDPRSLAITVRMIAQFLNLIVQNQTGAASHQYFELGPASTSNTLRKEVALLRAEFEKYKREHP
jgi:hypothetical protein